MSFITFNPFARSLTEATFPEILDGTKRAINMEMANLNKAILQSGAKLGYKFVSFSKIEEKLGYSITLEMEDKEKNVSVEFTLWLNGQNVGGGYSYQAGGMKPDGKSFKTLVDVFELANPVVKWLKDMADYPEIQSTQIQPQTKVPAKYQKTVDAYSDSNKLSKANRDLDFHNQAWFTAKEWKECMELAVPNGYNEFNSTKVGNVITKFPHLKYRTARESSVCMYVTDFKDKNDLVSFLAAVKNKMVADEVSVETESFGYSVDEVIKSVKLWNADDTYVKNQIVRVWWD